VTLPPMPSAWRKAASQPSAAASVRGGFAVFADYFAGSHAVTAQIADLVFDAALGPVRPGKALAFNDQYLSTAGCMYLVANGAYRFFADLRPVVGQVAVRSGRNVGLCAHPYDLCTYLIAQQAGVLITDPAGLRSLSYPLATDVDCGWIGYANQSVRDEMEAPLRSAIAQVEQAGSASLGRPSLPTRGCLFDVVAGRGAIRLVPDSSCGALSCGRTIQLRISDNWVLRILLPNGWGRETNNGSHHRRPRDHESAVGPPTSSSPPGVPRSLMALSVRLDIGCPSPTWM